MKKYYHQTEKSLRLLFLEEKTKLPVGYIYLNNSNNIWEVKTVVSHEGHSILLHEEAMKWVYPDSILPYRGDNINLKLAATYNHFINDSEFTAFKFSIQSKEYKDLPEHNDWYNRIYKYEKAPYFGEDFNYTHMNYNDIQSIGLKYFLSKYNK